ncbi:putative Pentatricopeptide repeat-containing protein [Abeliophyllum distichum]|uniref:Pentatricopeptide repeat-containing protein n=1 Tax=Abeliophyllum distichum TaxID=126358 RepID=A0ABD1TGL3_9LAMI
MNQHNSQSSKLNTLLQPLLKLQAPVQASTYAPIFQFLTGKNLLKPSQQLHAHMALRGLCPTAFLATKMVAMYASSGNISSASHIFHATANPSLLLFNSIIRAFSVKKQEAIKGRHSKDELICKNY